jgi:hypothetical protein
MSPAPGVDGGLEAFFFAFAWPRPGDEVGPGDDADELGKQQPAGGGVP